MIICKSTIEIEKMREAGRVVGQTLKRLAVMIEPGVKTAALDREAERFILKCGAIPTFKGYQGFPASICVSVNEQVVHGFPSSRKLKEGDIISIDCGATLDGYIGDAATTVCVGRCRPEVVKLVRTTREGLEAAIRASRTGNRLGDISHAVEAIARRNNYGIVKEYCGHGVGRELHEAPQVPNYGTPGTGVPVRAGWTIAIEPMLNLGRFEVKVLKDGWTVVTVDGEPSAHFEHSVAVTENGPVILTLP